MKITIIWQRSLILTVEKILLGGGKVGIGKELIGNGQDGIDIIAQIVRPEIIRPQGCLEQMQGHIGQQQSLFFQPVVILCPFLSHSVRLL